MGHNWLEKTPSEDAERRLITLIVEVTKKEMTTERDIIMKETKTAMMKYQGFYRFILLLMGRGKLGREVLLCYAILPYVVAYVVTYVFGRVKTWWMASEHASARDERPLLS
jgi:hypothetical protein